MSLVNAPEVLVWQAAVLQAVRDAEANNINQQCGTEEIYQWSKSSDCKETCYYAQLDHKAVRIGFIKIYLRFLDKEINEAQKFISKTIHSEEKIKAKIIEIEEKKQEVYNLWEEIKWDRL